MLRNSTSKVVIATLGEVNLTCSTVAVGGSPINALNQAVTNATAWLQIKQSFERLEGMEYDHSQLLTEYSYDLIKASRTEVEDAKFTIHDNLIDKFSKLGAGGVNSTIHTLTQYVRPTIRSIITSVQERLNGLANSDTEPMIVKWFNPPEFLLDHDAFMEFLAPQLNFKAGEIDLKSVYSSIANTYNIPRFLSGHHALDAYVGELWSEYIERSDVEKDSGERLDYLTSAFGSHWMNIGQRDGEDRMQALNGALLRLAIGLTLYNNPLEGTNTTLDEHNFNCKVMSSTAARELSRLCLALKGSQRVGEMVMAVTRDHSTPLERSVITVLSPTFTDFYNTHAGTIEQLMGAVLAGSETTAAKVFEESDRYNSLYTTAKAQRRKVIELNMSSYATNSLIAELHNELRGWDDEDLPSPRTEMERSIRTAANAIPSLTVLNIATYVEKLYCSIFYRNEPIIQRLLELLRNEMELNPDLPLPEAMYSIQLDYVCDWMASQMRIVKDVEKKPDGETVASIMNAVELACKILAKVSSDSVICKLGGEIANRELVERTFALKLIRRLEATS